MNLVSKSIDRVTDAPARIYDHAYVFQVQSEYIDYTAYNLDREPKRYKQNVLTTTRIYYNL